LHHQGRTKEEHIDVHATAKAAWETLSDFASVDLWAPGLWAAALLGEQRHGVGARRKLRHSLGFRIEEVVTEWNEGQGYGFDLVRAPFPMRDVQEKIWIEPNGAGVRIHSTVTYGMKLGFVGVWLDHGVVSPLVSRQMRRSLAGLKQLLEDSPGPDTASKAVTQSTAK
jgi:hypothetical protein